MKAFEDAGAEEARLGQAMIDTIEALRRQLGEAPAGGESTQVRALRARLEELERTSMTDPLTGAWNRRYLDAAMAAEIERSARQGQPLAAVLYDIDHFKRVNDALGHAAGDVALREFAALLRSQRRASDLLCRWGGEEFLVLMPGTNIEEAVAAAGRARAAVEACEFACGRITVSAGVAELASSESAQSFFERLDRLLYRAKGAGRNRVASDPGAAAAARGRARGGFLHLAWRQAYASGNACIDAEHRELFDLANQLVAVTLAGGSDSPAVGAALEAILAAAARHFANEEEILEGAGYPGLARHRKEHAALLARAESLRAAVARGEATFGALLEFIALDLIARHMLHADREFFPCLRGVQ